MKLGHISKQKNVQKYYYYLECEFIEFILFIESLYIMQSQDKLKFPRQRFDFFLASTEFSPLLEWFPLTHQLYVKNEISTLAELQKVLDLCVQLFHLFCL